MLQKDMFFRNCFLYDLDVETTKQRYISEIIKGELFSNGKGEMCLDDIYTYLLETIGIEFTFEEIEEALDKCVGTIFERTDDKYSITSEGFKEVTRNKEKFDLNVYIEKFLQVNPDCILNKERLSELIIRFVYDQFNKNATSINKIINNTVCINENINTYTNEEREIINNFLNWDNKDKNKCVFVIISKAYDFCVITSKNEETTDINFLDWEFYLDTNIFFRLAGLNNENRMILLDRFVAKSQNAKIPLKYTGFTKREIFNAIDCQIKYIADICIDYSMISPSELKHYSPDHMSEDFYKLFYDWSTKNNCRANYEGFKGYIYEKMEGILNNFIEDSSCISFFSDAKGYNVSNLESSMKEYMVDKNKFALRCDLNNLLFIDDKSKNNSKKNFCLITADGSVIKWANFTFPTKSLAELPSVWLSIILKFTGRTSDKDFAAFCNFINLRIAPHNETLDEKLDLLACVQVCTTDADIKGKILRDLRINSSKYQKYKTPEIKVKVAYETTLKNIKEETKNELERKIIKDTDNKYIKMLDEVTEEEQKKYNLQVKEMTEKFENESQQLKEKLTSSAELNTVITQAKVITDKQLPKYKRILFGFIIFIFLFIGYLIIDAIFIKKIVVCFTSNDLIWLGILISAFIIFLSAIIPILLYNNLFCYLNKDKIIGRNIKKLGEQAKIKREILNNYCDDNGFK